MEFEIVETELTEFVRNQLYQIYLKNFFRFINKQINV